LPGLSGKPPIFHAHGQLLVLARNIGFLRPYHEALFGGLKTVSRHLEGETKKKFDKFIESAISIRDMDLLVERLSNFWSQASFKNNPEQKLIEIRNFSQ
jgi:hypothetical protein